MKAIGTILLILGCMSGLGHMINMASNPDPERASGSASGLFIAIGFAGLGIYLISRANNKKKEQLEKEKWSGKSDNETY